MVRVIERINEVTNPAARFNMAVEHLATDWRKEFDEILDETDDTPPVVAARDERIERVHDLLDGGTMETRVAIIDGSPTISQADMAGSSLREAITDFSEIAVCNEVEDRLIERGWVPPDALGIDTEKTDRGPSDRYVNEEN
jgi:hypothetical protein